MGKGVCGAFFSNITYRNTRTPILDVVQNNNKAYYLKACTPSNQKTLFYDQLAVYWTYVGINLMFREHVIFCVNECLKLTARDVSMLQ